MLEIPRNSELANTIGRLDRADGNQDNSIDISRLSVTDKNQLNELINDRSNSLSENDRSSLRQIYSHNGQVSINIVPDNLQRTAHSAPLNRLLALSPPPSGDEASSLISELHNNGISDSQINQLINNHQSHGSASTLHALRAFSSVRESLNRIPDNQFTHQVRNYLNNASDDLLSGRLSVRIEDDTQAGGSAEYLQNDNVLVVKRNQDDSPRFRSLLVHELTHAGQDHSSVDMSHGQAETDAYFAQALHFIHVRALDRSQAEAALSGRPEEDRNLFMAAFNYADASRRGDTASAVRYREELGQAIAQHHIYNSNVNNTVDFNGL